MIYCYGACRARVLIFKLLESFSALYACLWTVIRIVHNLFALSLPQKQQKLSDRLPTARVLLHWTNLAGPEARPTRVVGLIGLAYMLRWIIPIMEECDRGNWRRFRWAEVLDEKIEFISTRCDKCNRWSRYSPLWPVNISHTPDRRILVSLSANSWSDIPIYNASDHWPGAIQCPLTCVWLLSDVIEVRKLCRMFDYASRCDVTSSNSPCFSTAGAMIPLLIQLLWDRTSMHGK